MGRSKRKLPSTQEETTVVKARPPRDDKSRLAKKESDRARGKTRINIGRAFERWRHFRELKGCKSDPELAFFLLDK